MKKAPKILDEIVDVVLAYRPAPNKREQKKKKGKTMNYEVAADKDFPNDWRVEAIDSKSGDIYVAVFSGPDAKQRAREYASWQQSLTRAA